MDTIRSWRFWVIVALALGTLACAGRAERRERKEEAREERRERAEARRAERQERLDQRRSERDTTNEPAPMSARERREAARQERRERAEQRQAPREQPQPAPAVQTAAAPATLTPTSTAVAPPEAPSRVIFMRVSKQSSNTNALLFDVTEPGDPKLIGNVGPASKLSYSLKPGLYTFMVLGDTAEFMQATIVGGKTYYALVIPRGGATRFSVEPVRQSEVGGKEFAGWDRGTKMLSGAGVSASYDAAAAADKRVRYWQEWSKKSETQRAELTLNAEDGR